MLERFNDHARRVIIDAQHEARKLNHDKVGTAHILLAMLSEEYGTAAIALKTNGFTHSNIRAVLLRSQPKGVVKIPDKQIPLTTECRLLYNASHKISLQLGHSYIGAEHLLLGLLEVGQREDVFLGGYHALVQKSNRNKPSTARIDNLRFTVLALLGSRVEKANTPVKIRSGRKSWQVEQSIVDAITSAQTRSGDKVIRFADLKVVITST